MISSVAVGHWNMQTPYTRGRSHEHVYRELRQDALFAESLGFDCLWMGEHHFVYDGYCPSTMAAAASVLASTERIHAGCGVLLFPLHGPARVAQAAEAIASFAPGRLELALAPGWREVEYLASGLSLSDRPRLMEEGVAALVDGEYAETFRSAGLWMGGSSPAALRRAGRMGASILLAFALPEDVVSRSATWRAAMRPQPVGQPRVGVIRDIWVDRDPDRLDWIRGRMREMWRFYAKFGDIPGEGEPLDEEANIDAMMRFGLVGSPEHVRDQLSAYHDAGVDQLVLRVRFDGLEATKVRHCLELVAAEVVPALKPDGGSAR